MELHDHHACSTNDVDLATAKAFNRPEGNRCSVNWITKWESRSFKLQLLLFDANTEGWRSRVQPYINHVFQLHDRIAERQSCVRVQHVHVAICFLGFPSQLRVLATGIKRPLLDKEWQASSVFYFRSNTLNSGAHVYSVDSSCIPLWFSSTIEIQQPLTLPLLVVIFYSAHIYFALLWPWQISLLIRSLDISIRAEVLFAIDSTKVLWGIILGITAGALVLVGSLFMERDKMIMKAGAGGAWKFWLDKSLFNRMVNLSRVYIEVHIRWRRLILI